MTEAAVVGIVSWFHVLFQIIARKWSDQYDPKPLRAFWWDLIDRPWHVLGVIITGKMSKHD